MYGKSLELESIIDKVYSKQNRKVIEEDRAQKQPLILKISEGFIFNIARKAILEKNSTFLVSIAGESASGKTTLVNNTAKACVRSNADIYTVISCDDYYKDASKELSEAGSYEELFKTGFSFDTPEVINLSLMREHLIALKNSESVISPRYDFVTCESFPDGEEKRPAKVILTEGLYVLNQELRDIMDVKVYVFTPLDVIKERWYKRAVSRGKTGEAADMQFKNVNETAQQYIRPNYLIADCIINGMVDKEYIKVITDKIMKKLAEIC